MRSDTNFRAELADRAYQALTHLDRRVGLGERARAFAKLLHGFRVGVRADGGVEKGPIYSPEHGVVDFTVPQFAPFMRRRYPFEG